MHQGRILLCSSLATVTDVTSFLMADKVLCASNNAQNYLNP